MAKRPWRWWLPHRWGERAAYALIRLVYRVLGVRNPPPGSQIRDLPRHMNGR